MYLQIIQALVNGIAIGGLYALMALSLTLIFGVTEILNFAHGDFVVLGSMFAFILFVQFGMNSYLALPLIFIFSLIVGILTYKMTITYAIKAPILNQIVITFGLLLVLENIMALSFGRDYKVLPAPTAISYKIHGIFFALDRYIVLIIAILIALLLIQILDKTHIGLAMRAISEDKVGASLMGINIDRVYLLAWSLGVGIAGIAGSLLAIIFPFNAYSGLGYVLKSFSIVVLGGLGSIGGSILGGFILGIAESLIQTYGSRMLAEIFSYMILIIVLIIKPTGFFGRK